MEQFSVNLEKIVVKGNNNTNLLYFENEFSEIIKNYHDKPNINKSLQELYNELNESVLHIKNTNNFDSVDAQIVVKKVIITLVDLYNLFIIIINVLLYKID